MSDLIERLKAGQDLLRLFVSSWNPRQSGKTSAGQLIVDIEEAIQALQAQQSKPVPECIQELVGGVLAIHRTSGYEVPERVTGDDEPCYWQRKEYVDWLFELAEQSRDLLANHPKLGDEESEYRGG